MARSPEEQAQTERFEELYETAMAPVMLAIERSVCGCDYGGTSWTSRDEAERIGKLLGLRPGLRYLDIGSGSGWPGLYLAGTSGCDIALVDLPLTGLRIAAERAAKDRLTGACWTVVADGAALSFRDGSFDAVGHSDVLCCLKDKRAVLAACRRAIRDGGRMVFTVIGVAPGLSPGDYRRAVENGPEFIETESDYPALLEETGWSLGERHDITTGYRAACDRQLSADAGREAPLRELIGDAAFTERRDEWRSKLEALDEGLLRRELFVAAPLAP